MSMSDKEATDKSPSDLPGDDDLVKTDTVHVEKLFSEEESSYPVPMPESIRDMSKEDLKSLEKKMVCKMDAVIMPIMGILYVLNYVDRSALAATKVYGITKDLNITTNQFAIAISILFVGYLPFQIPSNLIMTKITRPGLYICTAAAIWGSVSATTAAIQTYKSLLAIRVLLGVTEAVFFPGVIYFLSAWYTKNELGKRLAALFMFQMLGSAFGGFIGAACLTLDGRYGIAGWRWLFIVEDVITVGCGLISAMIMPEYPHNARLLKPIERDYAIWRLEMEAGAGEAHEDTAILGASTMGTIVNFFPSIVQTLGYGRIQTMLLTAPPYVLATIVFYGISYISDRKNTMYSIIMICLAVAAMAYITALSTLQTGARYFAMMLMPSACSGPQIMLYKTLNRHMARPFPKRAAGVAMMNSIGGLSNIWGSYLYYAPPHYYAAFGCLLGCVAAFVTTITGYLVYVRRINRLLDGSPEDQRKAMVSGVTRQQVDLGWRYIGY